MPNKANVAKPAGASKVQIGVSVARCFASSGRGTSTIAAREMGIGALLVLAFFVPYTVGWSWGWWKFAVSALLIVALWRWAKPATFRGDLGLQCRVADFLMGSLAVVAVGLTASLVIPRVLLPHGYIASPDYDRPWKFLAVPLQALNEEMVLRAFLLTGLAHFMQVRLPVSLAVAALFTALHFVLYEFGPSHTVLSISALGTLLLVGLACNEFFIASGSIAVPYGIHLGWNLTRFGNDWVSQQAASRLGQGTDFNLIEGDFWILTLAAGLTLVALVVRIRQSLCAAQSNIPAMS